MHPLLAKWRIQLLVVAVLLSVGAIAFKGIQMGVDFSGGTVLVFALDRPLSQEEMQETVQIISQRVDGSGLSSVVVRGWGDRHIVVELSTTKQEEVDYMKETILRQGRVEVVVDGNVVLSGEKIMSVGLATQTPLNEGVRWSLPFDLTPSGVEMFYNGIRGKCIGGCAHSFVYIDRPVDSIILIPKKVAEEEKFLASMPSLDAGGGSIPMEDILKNAGARAYVVDENFDMGSLKGEKEIILHPELNYLIPFLEDHNVGYRIVPSEEGQSWIWRATNLRSVIRLTPKITEGTAKSGSLFIEGWAKNKEEARKRADEMRIILRSGALPAEIEELVSEQRIPPTYGQQAFYAFIAAIIASMVVVSVYIAWRYRVREIAGPIILTILSETVIIFGFAALANWKIDVPAMVGLIAATGTGVDDQIVISDEALRGRRRDEEGGTLERIKRAFFVVFSAAGALFAVMVPVLGMGIPALKGFAMTTIIGIITGVTITRPAFAEMIHYVLTSKKP